MSPAASDTREPPIIGASDEVMALLGQLTTKQSELVTINLDNCDVMVMGFGFDGGGEIRQNAQGEDFTTGPQIQMQLRVDDIDGITDTKQYFPLKIKADGTVADPQASSQYGFWLSVLAGLGISGDPDIATRYQFTSLMDLAGLKFHRLLQGFEGYRGREVKVAVPTELYGFDNDFRATLGLKPAELAEEA